MKITSTLSDNFIPSRTSLGLREQLRNQIKFVIKTFKNKFDSPPRMQFLWHMLTPCKTESGFSAQPVTHNVESMVHIASQVGRAETH